MANTRRITEVLQQIGYEPQEGKTIVSPTHLKI